MSTQHPAPARGPRSSPIIWGTIVLAVCAYFTAQLVAPGAIEDVTFLVIGLIGLGLLLLAIAIAVIVRGARPHEAARSEESDRH